MARSQGLDLMRWTFDPLEARNAHFNFHKLGTVCRSYRPDYYGAMPDALNRDLPSDRLIVEWHLGGAVPVSDAVERSQPLVQGRNGLPEINLDAIESGSPLTIEAPADVQEMKRMAPEAALSWRLAVRQAFAAAFDRGYEAQDFREGAYVLVPSREMNSEH
jgi:predicted GNAT superfamily acetyltransferase